MQLMKLIVFLNGDMISVQNIGESVRLSMRLVMRLVYSDDGRIYYTENHYESFTLLYGEED